MNALAKSPVAINNVPQVPTFASTDQVAKDTDDRVTTTHNGVRWLYPWSAMVVGEQFFVADHGGLADAAVRSLNVWRWKTRTRAAGERYNASRQSVCGVRGIIIRRLR